MAGGRAYDEGKLQELILFASLRSLGDPGFGATKLNKVLFYSDFSAYRELGQSITGADYQHLPQGPCAYRLKPALQDLAESGALVEVPQEVYGGKTQRRPVAKREPVMDAFSGPEMVIIEETLAKLLPYNNKEVSEASHRTVGWRITRDLQQIPYGSAYISSDEPDDDDLAWLEGVGANGSVGEQSR
jgi:Protein of unknown function (DUF4065)